MAPDATEIEEGIAAVEREEAARKRELESPEAIREREKSREAFADLDTEEVQELLQTVFGEALTKLNADPARSLSDAEIVRPIGATAATVTEDGDSALLDAGIPVKTEDEDGDLRKVDLSLEDTAEGFETTNALSHVRIGDTAAEPVEVGEEGLAISQVGVAPSSASQRFGEQNIFQFETLTDTDTLVSPTASGVEIFNLLRSEQSPETFRFEIALPAGAELRPDGRGGAEIVKAGKTLASVPFPTAVDAQGTDVPVDLTIEGDTLALHVAHRQGDYALPILLDPILEDWVNSYSNWQNGHNLHVLTNGAWQWTSVPLGEIGLGTGAPCYYVCWGRGLYISAPSRNYAGHTYAEWSYWAPNNHSYISKVWLIPFWRENHDCSQSQYSQPHDYDGLWDHLNNGGHWNLLQVNQANNVGHAVMESWGRALIIGMHTGNGINIPCWREIYVGGAAIWLDDWNPPWIEGGLSGIHGIPSGWVSDETPFTITALAKDDGLGINNVRIHQWDGPIIYDIPPQDQCWGTRDRPCFTTHTASFENIDGGDFFSGERDVWLSGNDPTGKYTGDYHWTMRVDNTPPEMTLKGQFAEATNEVGSEEVPAGNGDQLSLPVYNLEIDAKDGSWDSPLNKRSGVKDIEIYLDGVEQSVPWSPQPCSGPNYSCAMKVTYPVQLSKLTTSGEHKLKVVAVDHVGKRLERHLEFEYFPATGMKDEYVMHYFHLPDGTGNEAEEEHPDRPELAVNVMNGNLVYREQDVEVEGAAVDLEVERYYNSMLPENEDTEWGDGWTLAQTPKLDPEPGQGQSPPTKASYLRSSAAIESSVFLPTTGGGTKFDPKLQAMVTKEAGGGYEIADESGETGTALAFDAAGKLTELRTGGYAKVDYSYEGGDLSGIAVEDPGSTDLLPEEVEELSEEPLEAPTYASSFGTNGSADGQLKNPADVALDAAGNVWVVDRSNHRIQKFNDKGEFLFKFGSSGSGNGKLSQPAAIAIDADGNLLVAERNNNRIQKFKPNGEYVSKFGTLGSGNGQFGSGGPEGVAVAPNGDIWVSDTYNGRVQRFNAAGEFIEVVATKGSQPGQVLEPSGIDAGPDGRVWVADWDGNRIAVFDQDGDFLFQFGVQGDGEGEFENPDEVHVDDAGMVWVGDQGNDRVQVFDQGGEFVEELGSPGSGEGQFNFNYPMGIATDGKGGLWITDTNNHRVQKWSVPYEPGLAYASSFGTEGEGNGQLDEPSDVAIDAAGNLWVADKSNNRVQKFNDKGQYLSQFGEWGSANGEMIRPAAIEIDAEGNLLVADKGNSRIQKFDDKGQYLAKFGTLGSGNGQFASGGPEGVAVAPNGDIWVSDTYNGRLQRFNGAGEFIEVVSSKGSGAGQLEEPSGIDIGPDGNAWVADWEGEKVVVFDEAGEFLFEFGVDGDGEGEFENPDEVHIDAYGKVWVGDQNNDRVQLFSQGGEYRDEFGSPGSGNGQFNLNFPMGIATDGKGVVWVTDPNNHRVQKWSLGKYAPPEEVIPTEDDPEVEVQTEGGLVMSVEGEEAGEHAYEHEGDFLVSYEGPQGETVYEKNAAGLLSEVTLPNGTWAKIKYYADNRVESVEVAPNGTNAKTTKFHYEDGPPRRSIVSPPGKPQITYDIGADGSVFKWWHKDAPPEIIALNGSLGFDKHGTEVAAGDLVLEVEGDSPHGIASIQIIANGNQLVSEKTCEQDPDPEIECERLEDLWVTDTASLAPGILNIEVIVTGENERSESRRWWVTIPHTPPPVPGSPVPPKFSEIQKFREDYGLEVIFPVANERELVERIFNLINAWYSPNTPAGEVARASWERWGVPLRPVDVAEMEYREWYMAVNIPLVEAWATQNRSSTYAGYYVDHAAGGILRVGFTQGQADALAQLKQQPGMVAVDRLVAYPTTPTSARISLQTTLDQVEAAWGSDPVLASLITGIGVDERSNTVEVTGTDPAQIESRLKLLLGSGAPVQGVYEAMGEEFKPRDRVDGRIHAGDRILRLKAGGALGGCTAGFGAWDRIGTKPNGEAKIAPFVMTAAHCGEIGVVFRRAKSNSEGAILTDTLKKIGHVGRTAFVNGGGPFETDAALVKLNAGDLMPRYIHKDVGSLKPVEEAGRPWPGETLCYSAPGAEVTRHPCGEFMGVRVRKTAGGKRYVIIARFAGMPGDSGGPVWSPRLRRSVGIILGGPNDGQGRYKGWVTPLLVPRNHEYHAAKVPGALNAPGLGTFHLAVPGN